MFPVRNSTQIKQHGAGAQTPHPLRVCNSGDIRILRLFGSGLRRTQTLDHVCLRGPLETASGGQIHGLDLTVNWRSASANRSNESAKDCGLRTDGPGRLATVTNGCRRYVAGESGRTAGVSARLVHGESPERSFSDPFSSGPLSPPAPCGILAPNSIGLKPQPGQEQSGRHLRKMLAKNVTSSTAPHLVRSGLTPCWFSRRSCGRSSSNTLSSKSTFGAHSESS